MIAAQPPVDVQLLELRIRERETLIQSLEAEQARDLVRFDELEGWRGAGMRDCADWITCVLGRNLQNARALIAAGRAARELPELGEAFVAGELSVDKMQLLGPVVAPDDQAGWVDTARESSPAELARRCREQRRGELLDAQRARAQRASRRLHTWWDELNMFRISGALPPDEGMMVQLALDRAGQELLQLRTEQNIVELEPPDSPFHARQADALAWICTDAVLGQPSDRAASSPPAQLVVHVDYDVLTGANPGGRCHIENGPSLPTAVLRRLGCDATLKTLIERNGEPIGAGREKPTVQPAMKLAVRSRDGICQAPGCAVEATRCEAHHIHHADDGGPTELWNLAALCSWHHQRHHDGVFDIRRTPEGDLTFVGAGGMVMGTATGGHWKRPRSRNRAGP